MSEEEVQKRTRPEEVAVINAALRWWTLGETNLKGETYWARKVAGWRSIGASIALRKAAAALSSARVRAQEDIEQQQRRDNVRPI